MTVVEIVLYYTNLLIIQYIGKVKARAQIEAFINPAVMDNLPVSVQNAFDIDTAEGVQLDVIGKYAGVTRYGQGQNAPIILIDSEFRLLIKLAIIKNSYGSSLAEIQQLLNQFFPDAIFVFDYLNMRMSYFVDSTAFSNELIQLVIQQDLLPYPMAVERGAIIYTDILDMFFGFRTYGAPGYNNNPFNDYDDYQMDWPWLTYDYAIAPADLADSSLLTQIDLDILVQEDGDGMYT